MKTQSLIAINLGHKFVAIKAEIIEIHGFAAGVHKTIGKSGWTVTSVGVGIAFAKSSVSRAEAIQLASDRIKRAGTGKVQAQLADLQWAPAVETLEAYVAPVKTAPTINVESICTALSEKSGVDIAIIRRVICSKGKNAGRLVAKCPSVWDDKEAAAVWLGLQPNPFKVSVGKVLFLPREHQDTVSRLGLTDWPDWLDADKARLVEFGVW